MQMKFKRAAGIGGTVYRLYAGKHAIGNVFEGMGAKDGPDPGWKWNLLLPGPRAQEGGGIEPTKEKAAAKLRAAAAQWFKDVGAVAAPAAEAA